MLHTGDTLLQEMGIEDSGRGSMASLREEILVTTSENEQKQVVLIDGPILGHSY